jgi:predicted RNA methylase
MNAELCQYFTPLWVAEQLLEQHFPRLTEHDNVMEPCCGSGTFLQAIPAHVPAFGVEIDRAVAEAYADMQNAGRSSSASCRATPSTRACRSR